MHIPYKELTVVFEGEEVLVINKHLLDKQNAWANLDLIKELHVKRLELEKDMHEPKPWHSEAWTQLQFDLQDAWGFPRNESYHRFWTVPGCKCPKMDNDDAYPARYYVITEGCPHHEV